MKDFHWDCRSNICASITGAAVLLAGAVLWLPGDTLAGAAGLPATFWTGTTDGTWTGSNWASDAAGTPTSALPTAADDVTFSISSGAAHQTTTLGRDFTIHSLTMSDPAAVTIGSGAGGPFTLTLSGNVGQGLNVQSGAGLVSIGANLTLSGASSFSQSTPNITVGNSAGAIITGSVGGSNALIKGGGGTLTLAGPGTYTGTGLFGSTVVRGGTLAVDYNGTTTFGTIGGGVAYAYGGTLKFLNAASPGNISVLANGGFSSGGNPIPNVVFSGTSTAGAAQVTVSHNFGDPNFAAGRVSFENSSTAGTGKFTNQGGGFGGINLFWRGGTITFRDTSTAGNGAFTNEGTNSSTGYTSIEFHTSSTAGNGTFDNRGSIRFSDSSSAGTATLQNGVGGTAGRGETFFDSSSTASNSTIINNAGSTTYFTGDSTGGTATVKVFGTGTLDVSAHNAPGVSIGSLEGTGNALLGAKNLTVGGNNLTTVFSGVIQDTGGGSLTKEGTATLALSGVNTYSGATRVSGGKLAVTGRLSATANVQVDAGATMELNNAAGNAVNPAAAYAGNGGTLAVADGTSNQAQAFVSLALSATSTVDFGAGNTGNALGFGTLTSATVTALKASTLTLNISHWRGTGYAPGITLSNGDPPQSHFYIGTTDLFGTGAIIPGVSFSDFGSGIEVFNTAAGRYELVPVPEPTTSVLLGCVALCALRLRRSRAAHA